MIFYTADGNDKTQIFEEKKKKKKKQLMTELILYIFWEEQVQPESVTSSKTAARSSKFHLRPSPTVRVQLDFSRRMVSR